MAGLLAVACLLHVLGGAARAGVVGQNTNNLNGGGCSRCHLDQMVKDCPLDVEFVLDMSDSVSPRDYERAREFVARQMIAVVGGFQGTQVGFLAFSNIVHTDRAIRPRGVRDLLELTGLVKTLVQQRYGTQLASALRRARQVLAAHNGTTLVPGGQRGKLIVLVSDGCQDNDRAVKKEAIQAHLDGISIVSVQLHDAYLDLLKAISIQVLELRTDIDWSSVVACPARFLPPITRTYKVCDDGDFVIAMDGSDSVRRWEKVMRDYLAYMAIRYSYQTNAMGVVVFGTNVNSQSSDTMIKPKRDKLQLAEEIEGKLSFPNERGTGTTQAIREATAFLRELALTGDPSINRTLVVITDGPALHPQSARQALANARLEGFQVVVIGVGDTLTAAELHGMAGQQSDVRQVDSYLDLFDVDLSEQICGQRGLVPCPAGQFHDVTGVCRSVPCPPGQNRDVITGLCGPFLPPCPAGQIQDVNTGLCIPEHFPLPCPAGQIQDVNTGLCKCPTTLNCSIGRIFDRNTCSCICNPNFSCGDSNTIFNTINCACDYGIVLNCGAGFYYDQTTFSCVCGNQCPDGIDQDPATCACKCSNQNTVNCNALQIFNNLTCACECPTTLNCSPEQIIDDTCSCI